VIPSEVGPGYTVIDETGIQHILGDPLGRPGRQGAVYRVKNQPGFAIKILNNPDDLVKIERVRRLPIDGLNIAAPITIIREGASGYLMPLAGDMQPLSSPYLPLEFGFRQTGDISWYEGTGGLRRRIGIGANIATAIASLHERGLAYVDLNPLNVMVSDDLNRIDTWLIDADNLTSRSHPEGNILGMRRYIAPERIIKGSPPSTLADAYSLAVVVFRMLILSHPLEGMASQNLDAESALESIDKGELAYVDDVFDATNRLPENSLQSILLELSLSQRTRELARDTFGSGKLDPLARPGAVRWRDALWRCYDNIVECQSGCGWTYFRLFSNCPKCKNETGQVSLASIFSSFSGESPLAVPAHTRSSLVIANRGATEITGRHLWGESNLRSPSLRIEPRGHQYALEAGRDLQITNVDGQSIDSTPPLTVNEEYRFLVALEGRATRVIRIARFEVR